MLTPDVALSRGAALLCKTSQSPPLWSSHLAGAVLPPLWSSHPPGAHERNGRRPQNRAKKERAPTLEPEHPNRVPAPVSCSLGSVFPCSFLRSWPPRGCSWFLVRLLGLSWLPVFCFVSLRCPEVVEMFGLQNGRRPYNRAFNRYPPGTLRPISCGSKLFLARYGSFICEWSNCYAVLSCRVQSSCCFASVFVDFHAVLL